jgi:lipid-binding SYLF domain-containing protein
MEESMNRILKGSILLAVICSLVACATTSSQSGRPLEQQLLVDEARLSVDTFAADPDMEWFRKYLKDARGVLIVPNLYKGAWFLGGSGGRGVLLLREQETGTWSGPAFYTLGSVSFGLQFGGQKSETIILVMTQKGIASLKKTSVKLGGEASIAAGPVGMAAQAATAPSLKVDYIVFARTKGAFVGVSLDGAVIDVNSEWNRAYYGKPVTPTDILQGHGVTNPDAAELRTAVAHAAVSPQ